MTKFIGYEMCVGKKENAFTKTQEKLKQELRGSVSLYVSSVVIAKYVWEPSFDLTDEFAYVGKCKSPRPHALHVTNVPQILRDVVSDYPEISKLRYPLRTSEQTMESLISTCAKGQRGGFEPYVPGEENFIISQMMFDEEGPSVPLWARECRLPTPREVLASVFKLSDDSNAGYPYCLHGSSKRDVALANFKATYRALCDRLLLLAESDEVPTDPVDIVRKGFADPVFAVEKNEPYDPTRKTCRTIIMGALLDELIDRLYTDSHDEFELDNFGRFRSGCGIGFTKEHLEFLVAACDDMVSDAREVCPELDPLKPLTKSDISGFDTNEFEEEALTEAEVLLQRYGLPAPGLETNAWQRYFRRVVINRTKVTFRSVLVFGDGTLWAQRTRGVQKSGTKRTTSRNTNVRSLRHLRCAYRWHISVDLCLSSPSPSSAELRSALGRSIAAGYDPSRQPWYKKYHPSLGVGDDMIEPAYPGLEQNYRNINTRLKDGSVGACSPDNFEFCSHVWVRGANAPRPLNAAKAAFRLLCDEPMPAKYVQWAFTYWHASDREVYVNLFRRLGHPVGKNKT